jgi:hypothetical protein
MRMMQRLRTLGVRRVRGIGEIRAAGERAASFYSDGEVVEFERIADHFTAELAYTLEIERFRAKLPGETTLTDVACE